MIGSPTLFAGPTLFLGPLAHLVTGLSQSWNQCGCCNHSINMNFEILGLTMI